MLYITELACNSLSNQKFFLGIKEFVMNRVLITIPLLQKDTTAKEACKREPLSGGLLTVSENESTAIMVHSKAVGRQGGRCWSLAKSYILSKDGGSERGRLDLVL